MEPCPPSLGMLMHSRQRNVTERGCASIGGHLDNCVCEPPATNEDAQSSETSGAASSTRAGVRSCDDAGRWVHRVWAHSDGSGAERMFGRDVRGGELKHMRR